VGTEFKVTQELLWYLNLRLTLDVYTQAITPGKHAAQAAVLSLVFSREGNGASHRHPPMLQREGIDTAAKRRPKGTHENVPFWVLDGFVEISATLLE